MCRTQIDVPNILTAGIDSKQKLEEQIIRVRGRENDQLGGTLNLLKR